MNPQNDKTKIEYLVHHDGVVHGPFNLTFVETMVMAGVYPANVRVQVVGESKIAPLAQGESGLLLVQPKRTNPDLLTQRQQRRERPLPAHNNLTPPPIPPKSSGAESKFVWGASVLGIMVLFWLLKEVTYTFKSNSSVASPSFTESTATTNATTSHPLSSTSAFPPTKPAIADTSNPPTPAPPIYSPSSASPYVPSSSNPPTRQSTPAAEESQIYRDSSGRTYRVPNSAYFHLISMKAALETKQRDLDAEENQLKSLANEIDRERIYLNRTSQSAVDAFNQKVSRVNSLNDRLQSLVDDYNHGVNAFNAELERVGTPIR